MKLLEKLGWDDRFQTYWESSGLGHFVPGRIIADYGSAYKVALPQEVSAETSGKLLYLANPDELPKAGDWVALQLIDKERAIIHEVLPRTSEVSRKQTSEKAQKQVLAANVDVAFIVQSLDDDFSVSRLQRYLFQLRRTGIEPVIVLNKADKADQIEEKLPQAGLLDTHIIISSALENKGISSIAKLIAPGKTAVFLGSSGVGKSTITNMLLGKRLQSTKTVRQSDSKGRHTTTHRELFLLPNGGMVIDTPGLRELQLWGSENELVDAFPDIEELALHCRFTNCSHSAEPGCAILSAKANGELDNGRLQSYLKFQKELRYLATQTDPEEALRRKHDHKKAQMHYNQASRAKKI